VKGLVLEWKKHYIKRLSKNRDLEVKKEIHPQYQMAKVHCACGNEFLTRSTVGDMRVDICAACHPFFTGRQKLIDTAGRVDKFMKKYRSESKAK
jgi:large subunit ribosomal protein L31